jgi:hypothetical protein
MIGMSGTWVGASGEMAVDMDEIRLRGKEALCITSNVRAGEGAQGNHIRRPRERGDP